MSNTAMTLEEMEQALKDAKLETLISLKNFEDHEEFLRWAFNSIMTLNDEYLKEQEKSKAKLLSEKGIKFLRKGLKSNVFDIVFNQNTLDELTKYGKCATIYFKDDELLIAVYNDPHKCDFKLDNIVVKRMRVNKKSEIINKVLTLKNEKIAVDLEIEKVTADGAIEQILFIPEQDPLRKENATIFKVVL